MRGMWRTEWGLAREGFARIAGVDEAGLGPLAGPVVAAAVVLPQGRVIRGLADSKRLTAGERERLFEAISERAISVGVGIVDARTIDRVNVLKASHMAMAAAVADLGEPPDLLLVDGRGWPGAPVVQRAIVGGDRTCASIAAASIVAKVTRDRLMAEIDAQYPGYGFARHKGYGTKEHVARLRDLGPCPEHRLSFAPVRQALQEGLPVHGVEGLP